MKTSGLIKIYAEVIIVRVVSMDHGILCELCLLTTSLACGSDLVSNDHSVAAFMENIHLSKLGPRRQMCRLSQVGYDVFCSISQDKLVACWLLYGRGVSVVV